MMQTDSGDGRPERGEQAAKTGAPNGSRVALGERLVVHCCHHKTGTVWFRRILNRIAELGGLRFHVGHQKAMPPGADIFMQPSSMIDATRLPEFVGTHMIRDPRDVLVSAYRYHLHSVEAWLHEPLPELGGLTYQEKLRGLSLEEGLEFEMTNRTRRNIRRMRQWDYGDPRFLELRYEEVIGDYDAWFRRIFRHYGVPEEQLHVCMRVARSKSFANVAGRPLGKLEERSHLRKGTPGQWRDELPRSTVERFKELYGNALIKLGYEKDFSW